MLEVQGILVEETIVDYGIKYEFHSGDNKITYDIVSMGIEEFHTFSHSNNDYEEYNLIMNNAITEIKSIAGMDWKIKFGNDLPNIMKIFRVFEFVGQRYAEIYKPDVIYYRFEDVRMHEAYRRWIEVKEYVLSFTGKDIAIYYREIENEV